MSAPSEPATWSRPTNPLASTSFVLGLTAVTVVAWRWLPFIGLVVTVLAITVAIPAIITGHLALQRAHEFAGAGRKLALWGLVAGYFSVAFSIISPLVSLVFFVTKSVIFVEENLPTLLEQFAQIWSQLSG